MWLWLVLFGHLINAVAFLVDKVLLEHVVRPPRAYAFFIGILSSVALFLLPLGVGGVSASGILADLVVGGMFIAALWGFFAALKSGEASRVVPFLGGSIPVFTWLLEMAFGQRFSGMEILAIGVLTAGTALIAWEPRQFYRGRHHATPWGLALVSAALFAFSMAGARVLFASQGFIASFFWQRLGGVIAALLLLGAARGRREISSVVNALPLAAAAAFLGNQLLGALGFFALQFALTKVSATVVQALQGVQYVFLLALTILLSIRYPRLMRENITAPTLALKLTSAGLIVAGIAILAGN